tara:strand:+ start:134 stop:427 length:294 start_codon:yes stop_codon:yes gene_type:complete
MEWAPDDTKRRNEMPDDKNELNTRKLFDMRTPIESVAVGIVLGVILPKRNQALRATFLAMEIASAANLSSDDVGTSQGIANRYLEKHYYNWRGVNDG